MRNLFFVLLSLVAAAPVLGQSGACASLPSASALAATDDVVIETSTPATECISGSNLFESIAAVLGLTDGSVVFVGGGTLTEDNSNIFFNDANDELYIGANALGSGRAKLYATRTLSSASATVERSVYGTISTSHTSGTSPTVYAGSFSASQSGAGGTVSALYGINNQATVTGGTASVLTGFNSLAKIDGGTGGIVYGVNSRALLEDGTNSSFLFGTWSSAELAFGGGGTSPSATAGVFPVQVEAGYTATEAKGVAVEFWSNAGTVPTSYGLFLDSSIDIGTTSYAIYSEADVDSYIEGDLGIGTSAPGAELEINDATNPTLIIEEVSGSPFELIDATANVADIRKTSVSGNAQLRIDPIPGNGAGKSFLQFFRNVNTSGGIEMVLYEGDDTDTRLHRFLNEDAFFGIQGGDVGIRTEAPGAALGIGTASDSTDDYIRLDWEAGEPPSADCNASAEYGREIYNSTLETKCVCVSDGWGCFPVTPQEIALAAYDPEPARSSANYIHGGLNVLDTASALNAVPTNITFSTGIGRLFVVVNAGSDTSGSITVSGTSVDRETGAETPADTDTLTVSGLTTDSTTTDSNGNSKWSFSNGYITSKWFTGSVTLSTADLALTDVDSYHVSFEQWNDRSPQYTVATFDSNIFATNAAAEYDSYLYAVEPSGDTASISLLAEHHVGADGPTAVANRYYRLRRGNLDKALDGSTDGIWTETHYSNSPAYIEDVTMKIWATVP